MIPTANSTLGKQEAKDQSRCSTDQASSTQDSPPDDLKLADLGRLGGIVVFGSGDGDQEDEGGKESSAEERKKTRQVRREKTEKSRLVTTRASTSFESPPFPLSIKVAEKRTTKTSSEKASSHGENQIRDQDESPPSAFSVQVVGRLNGADRRSW